MKILVIGSGGREHALAWALSQDAEVQAVYAAPGNPGIAQIARCVPIPPDDFERLIGFIGQEKIDLTVVGPERFLALGIVDRFRAAGYPIFGPDKRASQIESSKSFAKSLFERHNVPTARWQVFEDVAAATKSLNDFGPPWVIKADGLAAGKGVTVTDKRATAEAVLKRELSRPPGKVILEQFIDGWEASFMVTAVGSELIWMTPAFQDYKPVGNNDTGPNTGGMGVFTPVPSVTQVVTQRVVDNVIQPTLAGLAEEGINFNGLLCLNAIIPFGTEEPHVLEFNARFGDPEAQGLAPLIQSNFAEHLWAIATASSIRPKPTLNDLASVVIVVASKGYPTDPIFGDFITLEDYDESGAVIFHAGTALSQDGTLITSGGRVLNVVVTEKDVHQARTKAYNIIKHAVSFDGMHYRTDIADVSKQRRHALS